MPDKAYNLIDKASALRESLGDDYHDSLMESIFTDAANIADESVSREQQKARPTLDRTLDNLLTHRVWGMFVMFGLLMGVFWLTIEGANVPSAMLAGLLLDNVYNWLHAGFAAMGAPWWLSGFLIDGVYMATAWVVSVMLPPMAIFFPLFTLLEDFGYLPRVAFNLDKMFARAGAHGKQSLSMMMGFGCNAAGVISTRIIDSPRERLIAIITNNFSICNGRWPTLILMGTIFVGASAPPVIASFAAAGSVIAIMLLGVGFTLLISAFLSKTWLKGEASVYSLELPPYRPPEIMKTVYRSVIDRTLIVLWRAVVMAAPAGAVIWLTSNIIIADQSIAVWMVSWLNPFGLFIGLNGVILLAYIVAIPANEIVIPTILMLTLTAGGSASGLAEPGVMVEFGETQVYNVLTGVGGWTLLTAVNLMLFSLLHNPCSTTILTIWQETKNLKWTVVATILPIVLGIGVTLSLTTIARLFGWV